MDIIIVTIIVGVILLLGFIFLFVLANKRSYRTKGIESDVEVEEIEDEHPIKHYERKRDKLSIPKKKKQKESEDSFIFDRTLDTGIGFMPLLFGILTVGIVFMVGTTVMGNVAQILNTSTSTTSSYQSNDVVNVLDASVMQTINTMNSFMLVGFILTIVFIILRVFFLN